MSQKTERVIAERTNILTIELLRNLKRCGEVEHLRITVTRWLSELVTNSFKAKRKLDAENLKRERDADRYAVSALCAKELLNRSIAETKKLIEDMKQLNKDFDDYRELVKDTLRIAGRRAF